MKSKEVRQSTGFMGLEWAAFAVSVWTASTAWAHIVKWTILEIQPPRKTADTSRVPHPMLIGSHWRNDIGLDLWIVAHRGCESDRSDCESRCKGRSGRIDGVGRIGGKCFVVNFEE
jgi:hypothetical protein